MTKDGSTLGHKKKRNQKKNGLSCSHKSAQTIQDLKKVALCQKSSLSAWVESSEVKLYCVLHAVTEGLFFGDAAARVPPALKNYLK